MFLDYIDPNEQEMEFVKATSNHREEDVSQPNQELIHVVQMYKLNQNSLFNASCGKNPRNMHVEFASNLS